MRLTVVIGAATPPGRLAAAAASLAQYGRGAGACVEVVDLASAPLDPCDGRALDQCSQTTQDAVARIADADGVVFCSPTYRASYPGVLKNLLDLVPLDALRGKAVGIVAMGGSDHHFLGVDSQLRFVLGWFGAVVAPVSVYLTNRDFDEARRLADVRAAEVAALGASVIALANSLRGLDLGPAPLAGRGPG